MYRVPRAARGLQSATILPRLRPAPHFDSTGLRRSSNLSPDEFNKEVLREEAARGHSSQARPPVRATAEGSRPSQGQTEEGGTRRRAEKENGTDPFDATEFLAGTTAIVTPPLVRRSSQAPHEKDPTPSASTPTPKPDRPLIRYRRSLVLPNNRTRAPAAAKSLTLLFSRLAEGTTAPHVVKAISDAALAGHMASKTAVVQAADQLPSGAVRVTFRYSQGLREALQLARRGRLAVPGPHGPGPLRPLVLVYEGGAAAGPGPREAYDPRLFKAPDRQGPDVEGTLVRRVAHEYFRAPPNFTGGLRASAPPERAGDRGEEEEPVEEVWFDEQWRR